MTNPIFDKIFNTKFIHRKAYSVVFFFIVLSGLNVELFNTYQFGGLITPMRIGWVALAIYLFLRLSPQKIIFSIPIYLLGAWMLLHILNLVFIGGAGNTVLVRLVQCVFIGVLLLSISNRNFCLVEFGKSVAPIVSLAAAVLFLIFLICNLINNEIFELMRVSIIGNPANFSIFCAQLIAFSFLKILLTQPPQIRGLTLYYC